MTDRNTLAGFLAHPSKVAKLPEEWQTRTADTTCKDDDDEQSVGDDD